MQALGFQNEFTNLKSALAMEKAKAGLAFQFSTRIISVLFVEKWSEVLESFGEFLTSRWK